MDTKTLNLDFGDGEVEKLRDISRRMGEFIAHFELAESKMTEWKEEIQSLIIANQQVLNEQLSDIQQAANDLSQMLTETGAARWRIAAEEALSEGKTHIQALDDLHKRHLQAIQQSNEHFARLAKKSFDRLDRASSYTIKNVSEAVGSFRVADYQQVCEHSFKQIERTTNVAIERLKTLVQWFNWKNVGLTFSICLFTCVAMGLYINDQFPWESHRQAAMQRNAGKALINAWPKLTRTEQQRIIDFSKKTMI